MFYLPAEYIYRLRKACAVDGTRTALKGVYLDKVLGRAVATDGHKMAWFDSETIKNIPESIILKLPELKTPKSGRGSLPYYPFIGLPTVEGELCCLFWAHTDRRDTSVAVHVPSPGSPEYALCEVLKGCDYPNYAEAIPGPKDAFRLFSMDADIYKTMADIVCAPRNRCLVMHENINPLKAVRVMGYDNKMQGLVMPARVMDYENFETRFEMTAPSGIYCNDPSHATTPEERIANDSTRATVVKEYQSKLDELTAELSSVKAQLESTQVELAACRSEGPSIEPGVEGLMTPSQKRYLFILSGVNYRRETMTFKRASELIDQLKGVKA